MVRVIDYKKKEKENGETFYVLVLQGTPEFVRSVTTNKMYMTAKRASIPCTFDEATCQELIGTKYVGSIKRVPCEEYEYSIPESGEIVKLDFRYEYFPEATETIEEAVFDKA